jgi:thioredoxin 1
MSENLTPPANVVAATAAQFNELIEKHDIVVIDFWAEWCGPCRSFLPIFYQVAARYPNVLFLKVNIEEEEELARDFSIRSIPYLMVMRSRVVVFADAGLLPEEAFADLIQQAIDLDMHELLQQTKDAE